MVTIVQYLHFTNYAYGACMQRNQRCAVEIPKCDMKYKQTCNHIPWHDMNHSTLNYVCHDALVYLHRMRNWRALLAVGRY